MSDLLDEVRGSFTHSDTGETDSKIITPGDPDVPPAFGAMQARYRRRLMVFTRRGYRHFAGSTSITDAQELVLATAEVMAAPVMALVVESFAAGVMVGQRSDPLVLEALHYEAPEHLFHEDRFLAAAAVMAKGFVNDPEINDFFATFVVDAMKHLAQLTGLGTPGSELSQVWDLWIISGQAGIDTAYYAGNKLGTAWRERDLLDQVEISLQEGSEEG